MSKYKKKGLNPKKAVRTDSTGDGTLTFYMTRDELAEYYRQRRVENR